MAKFEIATQGHLSAAPGRVWANLVDREAAPCWLDGVGAIVSDGDRFLIRLDGAVPPSSSRPGHARGTGGSAGWIPGEVLAAEPRRRLALRLTTPGSGLREVQVEVGLAPVDGGTHFEIRVVGTHGLLGALVRPFLRFRSEVAMARAVRGFRAAVEARADRKRRPFADPCPERARQMAVGRVAATTAG